MRLELTPTVSCTRPALGGGPGAIDTPWPSAGPDTVDDWPEGSRLRESRRLALAHLPRQAMRAIGLFELRGEDGDSQGSALTHCYAA